MPPEEELHLGDIVYTDDGRIWMLITPNVSIAEAYGYHAWHALAMLKRDRHTGDWFQISDGWVFGAINALGLGPNTDAKHHLCPHGRE
jgi:hypothetical protein